MFAFWGGIRAQRVQARERMLRVIEAAVAAWESAAHFMFALIESEERTIFIVVCGMMAILSDHFVVVAGALFTRR